MKIRELVEPSTTCDTRGHLVPQVRTAPDDLPSTTLDADLRGAATDLLSSPDDSMLVVDCGVLVGVITVHDLLRGALADDDRQLCSDLSNHLLRVAGQGPLS